MSGEGREKKIVWVLTFNGEEDKHQAWWIRFRVHAKIAGFPKALGTDLEPDFPNNQTEVEVLTDRSDEN